MRRVRGINQLSKEVKELLIEISERKDNIYNHWSSWGGNYKRKKVDIHYIRYIPDDFDLLSDIEKLELTSYQKLILYLTYEPSIMSFTHALKSINSFDFYIFGGLNWSFSNEYYKHLIDELYPNFNKEKLLSNQRLQDKVLSFIIKSIYNKSTPHTEKIKRFILANKFLIEAEETETYEEFYKRNSADVMIDGKINLKLLEYSDDIFDLIENFSENYFGAMGDGVNKGVTKKLETITKQDYSKLLKESKIVCTNLKSLDNILSSEETKVKSFSENIDVMFGFIAKKISESSESGISIRRLFELLIEVRFTASDNLETDSLSTEITDLFSKDADKLTLSETIAVFLAMSNRKLWVRTGSAADSLYLLRDAFKKDIKKIAALLEYLILNNDKLPPTRTQWEEIIRDDIFLLNPSITVGMVDSMDKHSVSVNSIYELRKLYSRNWRK